MKNKFKLTLLYFINLSIVTMISFPLLACTTAKLKKDQKLINDIFDAINNDFTINYDNAPVEPIKDKILDVIKNTNFLSEKDWDLKNATVIIKLDNKEVSNLKMTNHSFEVTIPPAADQYKIISEKKIISNFNVTNKEQLKFFSSAMLSKFEISKINKILGNFDLKTDISAAVIENIKQALKFQWFSNNINVVFIPTEPDERAANVIKKTSHLIKFQLQSETILSDSKDINFIYTINPVNLTQLKDIPEAIPIKTELNGLATLANINTAVSLQILAAIKSLTNGEIIQSEMLNLAYFEAGDYAREWQEKKLDGEQDIYVEIKASENNESKVRNKARIKVKIKKSDH